MAVNLSRLDFVGTFDVFGCLETINVVKWFKLFLKAFRRIFLGNTLCCDGMRIHTNEHFEERYFVHFSWAQSWAAMRTCLFPKQTTVLGPELNENNPRHKANVFRFVTSWFWAVFLLEIQRNTMSTFIPKFVRKASFQGKLSAIANKVTWAARIF